MDRLEEFFALVAAFMWITGCAQSSSNAPDDLALQLVAAKQELAAQVQASNATEVADLVTSIAAAQKTFAAQPPAGQTYDAATLLNDEDIEQSTGHKVLNKAPSPAMGIVPNGCDGEGECSRIEN